MSDKRSSLERCRLLARTSRVDGNTRFGVTSASGAGHERGEVSMCGGRTPGIGRVADLVAQAQAEKIGVDEGTSLDSCRHLARTSCLDGHIRSCLE